MTYSIIGAGAIGSALAGQFSRSKTAVQIASHATPAKLQPLVSRVGSDVTAVSVREALEADIVFLAVPFDAVPSVVSAAPAWSGRIVVDCTNAIDFPGFTPKQLGGRLSSEVVADLVRGARLVKAFNTLPAAILALPSGVGGGRRLVFLSGDDASSKQRLSQLVGSFGFAPIDLGTVATGSSLQQFGGTLVGRNFIELS
jgi:predicted dinucleotide-binding enzyme